MTVEQTQVARRHVLQQVQAATLQPGRAAVQDRARDPSRAIRRTRVAGLARTAIRKLLPGSSSARWFLRGSIVQTINRYGRSCRPRSTAASAIGSAARRAAPPRFLQLQIDLADPAGAATSRGSNDARPCWESSPRGPRSSGITDSRSGGSPPKRRRTTRRRARCAAAPGSARPGDSRGP